MYNDVESEPKVNMLIRNSDNTRYKHHSAYLILLDSIMIVSNQPIMNFLLNYLISTPLEL